MGRSDAFSRCKIDIVAERAHNIQDTPTFEVM